jgi:hypothetical protein
MASALTPVRALVPGAFVKVRSVQAKGQSDPSKATLVGSKEQGKDLRRLPMELWMKKQRPGKKGEGAYEIIPNTWALRIA